MKLTINPQTAKPVFPITLKSDGKTEKFNDLAHIEGNLEEFQENHESYEAHDSDGAPLLFAVDALDIVLLRIRESGTTTYEEITVPDSEITRVVLEKDGQTVTRAIYFDANGKATRLPKSWDKETELEITDGSDVAQANYSDFENVWAKAQG